MILACMAEQLTRGLVFANQAVGNIKWFSIIVSAVRIAALPLSWLLLRMGYPSYVAIIVFLICETLGSYSRVIILSKISNFDRKDFYKQVLIRILPPILLAFAVCGLLYHYLSGWFGLVVSFVVTLLLYSGMVYYFGLTKEEKNTLIGVLNSFLGKIKR